MQGCPCAGASVCRSVRVQERPCACEFRTERKELRVSERLPAWDPGSYLNSLQQPSELLSNFQGLSSSQGPTGPARAQRC